MRKLTTLFLSFILTTSVFAVDFVTFCVYKENETVHYILGDNSGYTVPISKELFDKMSKEYNLPIIKVDSTVKGYLGFIIAVTEDGEKVYRLNTTFVTEEEFFANISKYGFTLQ